MDGYAVLMDLAPRTELAYEPPEPTRKHRPFRPYDGPRRLWPREGQVWKIGTERCVTVKVTFRDADDEMWPSFFMGRGEAGGMFTYGLEGAAARFALDCPTMLQTEGLQHQRVLGELVGVPSRTPDGTDAEARTPKVKVHVTGMSAWEETGHSYGLQRFPVGRCTISGALEMDGRRVPFADAPCRSSFSYPHRRKDVVFPAPNYALPSAEFSVRGKDLGLAGRLADREIRVHVAWEAVSDVTPEKPEAVRIPESPLEEAEPETPGIDDLEKLMGL
jgi:hypothetical protein